MYDTGRDSPGIYGSSRGLTPQNILARYFNVNTAWHHGSQRRQDTMAAGRLADRKIPACAACPQENAWLRDRQQISSQPSGPAPCRTLTLHTCYGTALHQGAQQGIRVPVARVLSHFCAPAHSVYLSSFLLMLSRLSNWFQLCRY